MKTCGDFGGIRRDGEPCTQPSSDGRCRWHTDEGSARLEDQKKEALELYRSGKSIVEAAAKVGVSPSTVWRWRDADPEYAAEFEDAKVASLRHRIDEVVSSVHRDVKYGDAPAGVTIFYWTNLARQLAHATGRAPEWVSVTRMEHTGAGGDPIEVREMVVNLPPEDEADE